MESKKYSTQINIVVIICFILLQLTNKIYSQEENGTLKTIKYQNPIKTEIIRDPNILYVNSKYYMTGTCYPFSELTGQNPGVKLWSSNDLVHWDFEKILVRPNEKSWYQKRFWAPEVLPYI